MTLALPREGKSIYGPQAKPDYAIDAETGCWVWQKSTFRGYAAHGDGTKPYRMYYERAYGPIPDGHHIHHACKNKACVNPAHLEALSPSEHFEHHWLHGRGLSLEDVREIRRLGRETHLSAREVAERFGLSRWSVRRYWNAQTWPDVEDGSVVMAPERFCARTDCDRPVIGRRDKRFCSERCKGTHNERLRRAAPKRSGDE